MVENYAIAWLGAALTLALGWARVLWVKLRQKGALMAEGSAALQEASDLSLRQQNLITFLEGRIEQQQTQLASAKADALYWEKLATDYEEEVMKIAGKGA